MDVGANICVSPLIFIPPEACIKDGKRAVVDGLKYDAYIFRFLVIELFTKQSVSKSVRQSSWSHLSPKRSIVMHEKTFNVVKKRF